MSSKRKFILSNGQIYHVFNRGVEKRSVFKSSKDYQRAITTIDFYRFQKTSLKLSEFLNLSLEERSNVYSKMITDSSKLVEIFCFCLMPNHFHLLIRQEQVGGISSFISNFTNSYTKYFNTKHNRVGHLFQGTFKAVLVESNEQLLYLSKYIHLNPARAFLVSQSLIETYPWSSLLEYINTSNRNVCKSTKILDNFPTRESYLKYLKDDTSNLNECKKVEELTFD